MAIGAGWAWAALGYHGVRMYDVRDPAAPVVVVGVLRVAVEEREGHGQVEVEIGGELRRFLMVAKMRGFDHDKRMVLYEIGPDGLEIGAPLTGYRGLLTGAARRVAEPEDDGSKGTA